VIRLRGGRIVTPDGVLEGAALAIEHGVIAEIAADTGASADDVACDGQWILPGFIDGHIHGVDGTDVLSGADAVARVAVSLPRHGVTAFCPTTVACAPEPLERFLSAVDAAVAASSARISRATSSIPTTTARSRPAACVCRRAPASR
jgi:N-acetylglucosamine-6-phosphate deacetylase